MHVLLYIAHLNRVRVLIPFQTYIKRLNRYFIHSVLVHLVNSVNYAVFPEMPDWKFLFSNHGMFGIGIGNACFQTAPDLRFFIDIETRVNGSRGSYESRKW